MSSEVNSEESSKNDDNLIKNASSESPEDEEKKEILPGFATFDDFTKVRLNVFDNNVYTHFKI